MYCLEPDIHKLSTFTQMSQFTISLPPLSSTAILVFVCCHCWKSCATMNPNIIGVLEQVELLARLSLGIDIQSLWHYKAYKSFDPPPQQVHFDPNLTLRVSHPHPPTRGIGVHLVVASKSKIEFVCELKPSRSPSIVVWCIIISHKPSHNRTSITWTWQQSFSQSSIFNDMHSNCAVLVANISRRMSTILSRTPRLLLLRVTFINRMINSVIDIAPQ